MLVTIISISESGDIMEMEILLSERRDFSLLLFLIFYLKTLSQGKVFNQNYCKINFQWEYAVVIAV